MSAGYRRRRKTIRDEKRKLDGFTRDIPEKDFAYLQANWERAITGPPIGTLQDLVEARQ